MVDVLKLLKKSKSVRFNMAVWVFIASITGLAITVQAENAVVTNGNKASVHVDFVIIIPETLSLEIGNSSRLTASLQNGPTLAEQSGPVQSLETTSVSAIGTLSAGGTMALTIQDSTLASGQNRRQVPVSAITWTTGGVDSTGGLENDASVSNSSRHSAAHTYSFKRVHPHKSDRDRRAITYTLSSP